MEYFLTKNFNLYGLLDVEYWKCTFCGFVSSKTHCEMSEEAWGQLNVAYHESYQHKGYNSDDPRWVDRLHSQAKVIDDAARIGLINESGKWLDYACGDGQLSSILRKDFGRDLFNYDKFMPSQDGFLNQDGLIPRTFDFVITTSVFEHFTQRLHYDEVESLVAPTGVFGLHTLICESIPQDPNWFYLLPVHCAFHTNKSMSILLEQWGYSESVYNVEARLWLFFKPGLCDVTRALSDAEKMSSKIQYLHSSNGFVDYWK
jgi:hypothetical protein